MGLEQNKLIMPSFIKSQFSCCPVIWMFCSRASMSKLSNIHEKCLRLITNYCDSNFNGLLESSHEFKIHKTYINYIMIEVYKYLLGLSPELMTDIFKSLQHLQYFVYLALKIYGQCVLKQMQQRFVLVCNGKKYPQQQKTLHHQKFSKQK